MSRLYIIILYCYVTFTGISKVLGNNEGCSSHMDPSTCSYLVSCRFNVELRNIYEYQYSDQISQLIHSRNCNYIYYNLQSYYPISLTYENNLQIHSPFNTNYINSIFPRESFENLVLIRSVDLSHNNYIDIPNFQQMDNLAILKLSDNYLSVAKLSNINELPKLTEIDLSHNFISDIVFESDQHVYRTLKKIDLSYNNLTKIPGAVFDPFDELENLDISHNYIDSLSHITFDGTKKLLYLNISYNKISDINSSLFRFIDLKLLDLSNNKIRNIKAIDFELLLNLETLDLHSNSISFIETDSFRNMIFLRHLYLNNNLLENLDKETLKNVTQLVSINLTNNSIKSLPRGLFKNNDIKEFAIKNNVLEGSLVKGTFEGFSFVTELDLSNQNLEAIDDYAFNGLQQIKVLLLNQNKIHMLASKCFKTIESLQRLDLSSNHIKHIEFVKDELINLFYLSLRNNQLTAVKQDDFHGLNSLQFLDLSNNKITQIETNSFISLQELINFEISNNPLSGHLEQSTFNGLNSLPSLDLSCTSISNVKNCSFIGMVQLKSLNASRSKINSLEYNTFIHTGIIEIIDLSYNELKEFCINSTDLVSLKTLYLNNNLLETLDSTTFQKYTILEYLQLAHNQIKDIDANIFAKMKQLRFLDFSYNKNLKLNLLWLDKTKNVDELILSGIKTIVSFDKVNDMSLSKLTISNSSVTDVKMLQLNYLDHLDTLSLSCNNISTLETGGFYNISTLKNLDVSYNKLKFVQPGVFRDNTMLHTLNISHNFLTTISYGIFHGLIYLQTLDISYNNIKDLQNERFYEVSSLRVLIADHNKIESINVEEFEGTKLSQLSIGDNPIPCEVLINFKQRRSNEYSEFKITAIRLDENNENFEGITCNKKSQYLDRIVNSETPITKDNAVLLSIRDILMDRLSIPVYTPPNNLNEPYLVNITDLIQKSNADTNNKISNIMSESALAAVKNNQTNILLGRILEVLRSNSATTLPPVKITKDNATYDNLILYINRVKQELKEDMRLEKNRQDEIEAKVSDMNSRKIPVLLPQHEKLTASADTKSMFTETCVALILLILVGFVLFKIYKSRMYVKQRLSVSTRELPEAMDSSL